MWGRGDVLWGGVSEEGLGATQIIPFLLKSGKNTKPKYIQFFFSFFFFFFIIYLFIYLFLSFSRMQLKTITKNTLFIIFLIIDFFSYYFDFFKLSILFI